MTRPKRRIATLIGFAATLALAIQAGAPAPAAPARGADTRQPNIVVVMTDDQRDDDLKVMKGLKRRLAGSGVHFRNNFATYPLCCPSRATFLTGQYAHNHGVFDNGGSEGGVRAFDDAITVGTQLEEEGYRTAYYGKYLNGWPGEARRDPVEAIPPGWNKWFGLIDTGQYDWSADANGKVRRFGSDPSDYQTDVLARLSRRYISDHAGRPHPFFMTVMTNAPHGEKGRRFADRNPRPAKRHYGTFQKKRLPRPPSFNEDDVSDKPPFLRVPRLEPEERHELRDKYRGRLESLLSVDELVTGLIRELRRQKELRETYVIFTSDNGFMFGEHRLERKRLLYEESARVPLVMRGPGIPRGVRARALTGNIDIAPTIYDAAGVQPPAAREPDGISLLKVADNPGAWMDRDLLLENYHLGSRDGRGVGLRTQDGVLIRQTVDGKDFHEFYVLERGSQYYDPFQLENQYGNPAYAAQITQMQARMNQLRDCQGSGCN